MDSALVRAGARCHRTQMQVWEMVGAVAAAQFGLVARWQLRLLGVSPATIQERLDQHGWRVVHRGVYALPGTPDSALRRAAAALLAYSQGSKALDRIRALRTAGATPVEALVGAAFGPWAVLTGPTAAYLRGLLTAEPDEVHVMASDDGSRTKCPGVRRSAPGFCGADWDLVDRLPVAVPDRLVADIAALGGGKGGEAALARLIATVDAKRAGSVDTIVKAAKARGAFKGKALLLRVCASLCGGLSHSATESRARGWVTEIAARYGLTVAPRPHAIKVNGRIIAEADIAVLEIRYDVEVDGPHHLLPAQVARDKRRDREAGRAHWTTDRFPVDEIDADPRAFAAAVEQRIRQLQARIR